MHSMRSHPTVAHPGHQRRRGAFRVGGAVAAVAASGWMAASCSLIYELGHEQCTTDLDCSAKGGVFADMVCVQNLCELPTQSGCNSNAECIDAPGNGGQPMACIERACVPVTSTDCPVMLPLDALGLANLRSANPLILGGYANIPPEQAGVQVLNYNLALTEFTRRLEGLAGPNGRRNLVMVVCQANIGEDRSSLDRSLAHLVNLRVPGVVSALLGDDLQYVFDNGGQQANMFFMSAVEADPVLTSLEDNGLVWHILPSADYVARAYAPLLDRTLNYLNVSGGPVRVAAVVANDVRFLSDVMDTVRSSEFGLKFNEGKTVSENSTELNYRGFEISETDPDAAYTAQIQGILEFKPHVIVAAAADGFLKKMVPLIEQDWPEGVGDPPRPFYLLSPFHYNNSEIPVLLATNPEVRSRLVGVNAAAAEDPTLYQDYLGRWNEAYIELRDFGGYENYYDAPYYLIYSAMAAGSVLGSGIDLRDGMLRLLEGEEYNMGPSDLLRVQSALNVPRATIQLNGTMGPPDFDRPTGTRAAVGSAWCVDSRDIDDDGDNDVVNLPDVLRYDPNTKTMDGVMPCIDGF